MFRNQSGARCPIGHAQGSGLTRSPAQQPLRLLHLHVVDFNKAACGLYERCGFRKFGRVEDFYLIAGRKFDAFAYVKHLNGARGPFWWEVSSAISFQ